jgi:hypothetical protein
MPQSATKSALRREPIRGKDTDWAIPEELLQTLVDIMVIHGLRSIAVAQLAGPAHSTAIGHEDVAALAEQRSKAVNLFMQAVLDNPAHSVDDVSCYKLDIMGALVTLVQENLPWLTVYAYMNGELEVTLDAFYVLLGLRRHPAAAPS